MLVTGLARCNHCWLASLSQSPIHVVVLEQQRLGGRAWLRSSTLFERQAYRTPITMEASYSKEGEEERMRQ